MHIHVHMPKCWTTTADINNHGLLWNSVKLLIPICSLNDIRPQARSGKSEEIMQHGRKLVQHAY